jgi:hypothetical protein
VRRRSAAVALAVAASVLAAAWPAAAHDAGAITKAAGATSGTLRWDRADYGISNPRLSVTRQGVEYAITIADVCEEGCILVADGSGIGQSMLNVADLDGDGEPEVLVDTFSGGAHCCLTTRVLTWNGSGYTPADVAWRDGSWKLRDADGDGDRELVGQDPQFWDVFTSHAASAVPPLVLEKHGDQLVTATKKYKSLLRKDAEVWRRALRKARQGDDVRGILAAYVADQYMLRQGATGRREVDRQRKAGRVSKGFKALLLKKLKQFGI